MKSKIIICLILLVHINLCGFAQASKFRIITYNIMDGFNWGKDTARQMNTANWLKLQQPNVVALQELCGYTPERLAKEAAQWGHPYSALLKTTGYSVGLTSNWPITVIERKTAGLWHGMLHCQVNGIDFFVVHLSPDDYKFRNAEADTIIKSVNETLINNKQCVVLGDFNANSPFDDDLNKTKLLLLQRDIRDDLKSTKYKNMANDYFDYSVVSKFISASLIDVCQKFTPADQRFSYSTPILIPRYRKSMDEVVKMRQRIDYIFVSPDLATHCTDANIANGSATGYLSDHYPSIADFNLSK